MNVTTNKATTSLDTVADLSLSAVCLILKQTISNLFSSCMRHFISSKVNGQIFGVVLENDLAIRILSREMTFVSNGVYTDGPTCKCINAIPLDCDLFLC